jgi:hypothetical protein
MLSTRPIVLRERDFPIGRLPFFASFRERVRWLKTACAGQAAKSTLFNTRFSPAAPAKLD